MLFVLINEQLLYIIVYILMFITNILYNVIQLFIKSLINLIIKNLLIKSAARKVIIEKEREYN